MTTLGIQIARVSTQPGAFVHRPAAHHLVRIHAGPPVRVACGHRGEILIRSRGQIDLLPAGLGEAWRELDPSRSIELSIPPTAVTRVRETEETLLPLGPRFHFRDDRIEDLSRELLSEATNGSPTGHAYREGLGTALVARLLAGPRATKLDREGLSLAQRARVAEAVEGNLAGDLSVGRLARHAGLSSSQFKLLFRLTFGTSPHAYVVERRVRRARALLEDSNRTFAEIALEVGFTHQSHMARWLRRLTGTTPSALRRGRRA